jgi:glycosyltransferase involved in cell wall biosynthesis
MRMSIYAHPHVRKSGSYFGYAYAYYEIERHLRNYEYNGTKLQLDINSPKSNVQLYFGSPPGYFYPHQYKIQMTQWESTKVPPAWVGYAKSYNEWWTANEFGKQAFINSGVPEEKVHVYEHGVDHELWNKHLRGKNKKIRFLHIDSGSPRKRADLVKKAFNICFKDNDNYELTFKHSHIPASGVNWNDVNIMESHGEWETSNIRHIRENMNIDDLVSLFKFHDILLYPSEGEGFGLIPLQALATGMPVISTGRWCSYEKFLNGNVIDSKLGVSDIVETYTRHGEVVIPDLDSMVYLINNSVNDFNKQSNVFYQQVNDIIEEYDWERLTFKAMNNFIKRNGEECLSIYKGYLNDYK